MRTYVHKVVVSQSPGPIPGYPHLSLSAQKFDGNNTLIEEDSLNFKPSEHTKWDELFESMSKNSAHSDEIEGKLTQMVLALAISIKKMVYWDGRCLSKAEDDEFKKTVPTENATFTVSPNEFKKLTEAIKSHKKNPPAYSCLHNALAFFGVTAHHCGTLVADTLNRSTALKVPLRFDTQTTWNELVKPPAANPLTLALFKHETDQFVHRERFDINPFL